MRKYEQEKLYWLNKNFQSFTSSELIVTPFRNDPLFRTI